VNRQKLKVSHNQVHALPYRAKVGDLRPLAQYFENSDGELLAPAVVRDRASQQYLIIGGERRWRAAERVTANTLFVIVCDHWADYLAWLTLDKIRENPAYPAAPLPVTDVVILSNLIKQYLNPGRDERLDDTLGEYFDTKPSRIGETRSLKRILDAVNPPEIERLAAIEWDAVARGEASPSAAFQRVRSAQLKLTAPPVDVRVQRQKLTGVIMVCAGLVDALANFGEASPELTDDEVQGYVKALADGRRTLESVINKLNKRGQS
jgi:hypothetical protein